MEWAEVYREAAAWCMLLWLWRGPYKDACRQRDELLALVVEFSVLARDAVATAECHVRKK